MNYAKTAVERAQQSIATAVMCLLMLAAAPADASIQSVDLGISPGHLTSSQQAGFDAFSLDAFGATLERLMPPAEESCAGGRCEMSGGASANPQRSTPKSKSPPSEKLPSEETTQYALLQGSGTSSSTTSTTSSTGVTSCGCFAATPSATPQVADDPLIDRYDAERTLFLPDAPGITIDRPPKATPARQRL